MSHPHHLTSLATRESIADALYRANYALDHNDAALFDSAFASEDVVFEFHGPNDVRNLTNLTTIREQILGLVGPMDTTHMTTNVRVDVKDGADTASLASLTLGQHCPPGRGKELNGPKYLVGGENTLDLVRGGDGVWRIKKWTLDVMWRQGDDSVIYGQRGEGHN